MQIDRQVHQQSSPLSQLYLRRCSRTRAVDKLNLEWPDEKRQAMQSVPSMAGQSVVLPAFFPLPHETQ